MTITLTTLRPVESTADPEDDIWHIVCHCTDDNIAACGRDATHDTWGGGDMVCSLCALAWPDGSPTCPWGCDCEDDCGPEVIA